MIVKIKSITLEKFKGCRNTTYEFDGNAKISGKNGAGKTTIATAWYWLVSDRDAELHSNPKIRPIDAEEVTPRVTAVLDIDGREITISKSQKCTVKKLKTGGADNISLSNSYEVNFVECGERDFKKKLTEYGFDFDILLPLSHPDVFLSKKADDMRKVLFGMASDKSDYEIAKQTENVADVAELLNSYTFDEIKAMQNATIRKIKEEYGKDGEILRAKIEGLEKAKVDIDVAELELQRNALKEDIRQNQEKQDDTSKQYEAYQKLSKEITNLKIQMSDMERTANEELYKKKNKLKVQIEENNSEVEAIERTIRNNNFTINNTKHTINGLQDSIEYWREQWNINNDLAFDENSLVCSYCGQEYPEEKKEALKAEFEVKKQNGFEYITKMGDNCKHNIDEKKKFVDDLKKKNEDLSNKKNDTNNILEKLKVEYEALPETIDISDTAEYKELREQFYDKESELQKYSSDNAQETLKAEYDALNNQLMETEREIAKFENNVHIDEQIAELREKQGIYEQNKANAEKILYQLDLVSRRKNELLTEEINSYFDIVKWQLFEYQKNGEYKNCCVPLIDGKRFGESTNTGREVLAKLDIIKGLQRFYEQSYPAFLDGAECLSEETMSRIDMGCQIIYLSVSEDKGLRIEAVE